jgi:hypothetical protein
MSAALKDAQQLLDKLKVCVLCLRGMHSSPAWLLCAASVWPQPSLAVACPRTRARLQAANSKKDHATATSVLNQLKVCACARDVIVTSCGGTHAASCTANA